MGLHPGGSASGGSASTGGGLGKSPPRSAYGGGGVDPLPEIHGILPDMANKRVAGILLESILVFNKNAFQ